MKEYDCKICDSRWLEDEGVFASICPNCWGRKDLAGARKGDPVKSPAGYTQGEIECIEALESALTAEEFRGFCKGSALSYIWREQLKGHNEDFEKAITYLQWAIQGGKR